MRSNNRVLDCIRSMDYLRKKRVLIMTSGGVDSMALVHAMFSLQDDLNIDIGVFHLDHMTRGMESAKDAKFVRAQARQKGIDFYSYRRAAARIADESGEGFEICSRRIRYFLANTVLAFEGYDYLASAHHQDDNAESILLHFIRGAGLKGLSGIPQVEGRLIRPFIGIKKSEILSYANAFNIAYREDVSNATNDYSRNYIRNEIVPRIEKLNPDFSRTVSEAGKLLFEDYCAIEEECNLAYEASVSADSDVLVLDANTFFDFNAAIKTALLRKLILKLNGNLIDVYSGAISELLKLIANANTGAFVDYKDLHFEYSRGKLYVKRINGLNNEHCAAHNLRNADLKLGDNYIGKVNIRASKLFLDKGKAAEITSELNLDDSNLLLIDLNKEGLTGIGELSMRHRKAKDYIRPLRMKGKSKSIKKLFIEHKLRSDEKNKAILLCRGSEVLWAVGIEKGNCHKKMLTSDDENKNFIILRAITL